MTTEEFLITMNNNTKNNKYLSKLERTHNKAIKRINDINLLKKLYYNKYLIKEENIPNYQNKRIIITTQQKSLETWLNYLLNENNLYPIWIKYWIFQGIIKIGSHDEDNDIYLKRSKKTKAPFIELDKEIIKECINIIEKYIEENPQKISPINFSKLYTKLLQDKKNNNHKKQTIEEGIWITYHKETEEEIETKIKNNITPEYKKLYYSLQEHYTGWCTADIELTAYSQICGKRGYIGGDFHVYYTKDKDNNYTIPRIAIRMDKNNIGEIRGIAKGQNLENGLEKIVSEKIKTFQNINQYNINHYLKIIEHMKKLTELTNKQTKKQDFTQEDIKFIYETEQKIEHFGWEFDPRVNRIIKKRNHQEDYNKLKTNKEKIDFLIAIKDKLIVEDIKESKKEILEKTIEKNPFTLIYGTEALKDDKEIVLKAVKKSGYTIEYASQRLKKDKEIVLTAIKNREGAIRYIDETLLQDKEFLKEVIKENRFVQFELDRINQQKEENYKPKRLIKGE